MVSMTPLRRIVFFFGLVLACIGIGLAAPTYAQFDGCPQGFCKGGGPQNGPQVALYFTTGQDFGCNGLTNCLSFIDGPLSLLSVRSSRLSDAQLQALTQ